MTAVINQVTGYPHSLSEPEGLFTISRVIHNLGKLFTKCNDLLTKVSKISTLRALATGKRLKEGFAPGKICNVMLPENLVAEK